MVTPEPAKEIEQIMDKPASSFQPAKRSETSAVKKTLKKTIEAPWGKL